MNLKSNTHLCKSLPTYTNTYTCTAFKKQFWGFGTSKTWRNSDLALVHNGSYHTLARRSPIVLLRILDPCRRLSLGLV